MKPGIRFISAEASVLLDFLRLGASLTVLYIHARNLWFPNLLAEVKEPGDVAHAAVVVFFILSGYVIAYTTTSNNRGPKYYALARLSRLYSVVFPALIITASVEAVLTHIAPEIITEHSRGLSWPRYFVAASFSNEIWFLSAAPLLNTPLWSLSFEFWYYVIFGFWFYRPAGCKGFLLLAAVCLLAGPKILVMMPLWLAGMVAYRLSPSRLSVPAAWGLVGISLLGAALLVWCLPPLPFSLGHVPLFFASQFLTDWIIGFFVAVALWALPPANILIPPARWISRFRQLADLTFPIYVLHFPLLVLWQGIFGSRLYDARQLTMALLFVFFTTALLGVILEKQRPAWTRVFSQILGRFS